MLSIGIQDTKKENKLRVKQYLSLTGTFFLFLFNFFGCQVVFIAVIVLENVFFPFCPMFVFTAKSSSYALMLVLYKNKLRNKVPL